MFRCSPFFLDSVSFSDYLFVPAREKCCSVKEFHWVFIALIWVWIMGWTLPRMSSWDSNRDESFGVWWSEGKHSCSSWSSQILTHPTMMEKAIMCFASYTEKCVHETVPRIDRDTLGKACMLSLTTKYFPKLLLSVRQNISVQDDNFLDFSLNCQCQFDASTVYTRV